jgi:hypothetical protein
MSAISGQTRAISPAASGEAGVFFEQHVGAAFLSLLLVRGIPPCLTHCQLVEVHFQAKHQGWHTDDLLLVGENAEKQRMRLAIQVKRRFVISRNDQDFRETIANAWRDFWTKHPYNPLTDGFAVITLRGSESLLNYFATLLETARFCRDAADFRHRIELPGFLHQTVHKYYEDLFAVIEDEAGKVDPSEIFEFLKRLHLLSFDLNSSTAQTEAFIKSLLAHSAQGADKVGAANLTWNQLLALVGTGEPHAASFQHGDLPEDARQRHTAIPNQEYEALATLQHHSWPIQRAASAKIKAAYHLERKALLSEIMSALDNSRIVVVTGAAGSGKSALAGHIFEQMSAEMPAFAFRAEEFSRSHIDETLHSAQVQLTARQVSAILALQPDKLFWIESLERLLEKTERAAFVDLLQMVREDESCRLLLTCRDYSVDLIRSSFLEQAGMNHQVVIVPLLSDAELNQVLEEFPKLKPLGLRKSIRKLLQNLYILDKAARMEWKEGALLPENERSFREKVWRDIIREDQNPSDSMPHRRGTTFIQIALLRARSLNPYADCSALDRAALDRLRGSGLLEFAEKSEDLVAPAHDILEDWALLKWLDEQFARLEGDPEKCLLEVGTHPALRRTYRNWLEEMLECEPERADRLVARTVGSEKLPQQLQDDTLVAVLLSGTAGQFLERNEATLLANECALLKRVIHLLRVGCKSSGTVARLEDTAPWIHYLPKYPAWAVVLKILRKHVKSLAPRNSDLIIGMLGDWIQGVSWLLPYPDGADDAAQIAFALLSANDRRYWEREAVEKLLQVITRIPNGAPESIRELAERVKSPGREDYVARDFAERVLEHLDGLPMCRDFPKEVIQMAEAQWGITREQRDRADWSHYRDHFDVEVAFGLPATLSFDFFPPSAYHGPFRGLLTHHPRLAVDFILRFANYCADVYGDPKVFHRFVELPDKTTLVLPDGTQKEQWCNWRLWALYRGAHVGPQVLECALMALEHWLLEVCRSRPGEVEGWLLELLSRSNNVGITAVVASVAVAYPPLPGMAGPVLMTSREAIELDQARMVQDYHPVGRFLEGMAANDAEHDFYNKERKEADSLEHRSHDLQYLAVQLQTGHLRNRVWDIFDDHEKQLPPPAQQGQADKLWRLALLKMDLRHWEDKGVTSGGEQLVGPKAPEADVQEVIDSHAPKQRAFEERLRLLMWGMAIFRGEEKLQANPDEWRQQSAQARKVYTDLKTNVDPEDDVGWRMGLAGPAYVAAVLVRDHWKELPPEEREWVAGVITDSISRDADSKDDFFIAGKNPMDASRPGAFVLPALFNCGLGPEREKQLLQSLALALTHASDEVRDYAAEGVGVFLWNADRDLALTCIGAFVSAATMQNAAAKLKELGRVLERPDIDIDSILEGAKRVFKTSIQNRERLKEESLFALDLDDWPGRSALHYLLPIFAHAPKEALTQRFFRKLCEALASWWRKDADDGERQHERRHYQLELLCVQRIANFVLQLSPAEATETCAPLTSIANDSPKEVGQFLEQLIIAEDAMGSGSTFWTLWEAFADRVLQAPWTASISDRDSERIKFSNSLFLTVPWKEGVRSWQRLAGNEPRLDRLFAALPPTAPTLVAYTCYLTTVGEKSLPGAFVLISEKLREARRKPSLLSPTVQFYLESLLRRWVLGYSGTLKATPELRAAVLYILDELVEAGSSVAFRLRDDFVTPGSNKLPAPAPPDVNAQV